LSLELVLTAHPTEITRRTLIHKMVEVNNCLKQLDNKDADYERHQLMRRLRQLIAQSWHTDEIRKRPARSMKPNGALRWWKTACGKGA
jgi:phosphoenolpyruvate carboxylase